MYFFNANEGVIGGDQGIIRTTNGSTFSQVYSVTGTINSISLKGTNGYAGGLFNTNVNLCKSTNSGATWTAVPFPYGEIRAVVTLSQDTVLAATLNKIYKSTDGGIYWDEFVLPTLNGNINSMRFRDSNFGYAVGDDGMGIKTANGGGATRPIPVFTVPAGSFCQYSNVTFTNTSNPAYTFQWLVDGVPVSTSYNYTYTMNAPFAHNISLVAFNGSLYDTLEQNIYVQPEDFIQPLTILTDTICYNSTGGTIQVPNSASGIVIYTPQWIYCNNYDANW